MPSSPESVDRFLWISASSDSEDSEMFNGDIKAYNRSKTKEQIKPDPEQSIDSAEEHRRSRKKRKLSVGSEAELERKVKIEVASDAESTRRRKRRTQEDTASDAESTCRSKTRTHEDTASDAESTRHRKRQKKEDTVKEEDVQDDSYLELRVQQESFIQPLKHNVPKKKKKRKSSVTDQSHSENDEGLYSGTQIEVKEEQDKINSTCENADNTVSTKKKKKKCKKEKKRYGDMEVEEEFSAAETVLQSPPRNGFHKQRKEHKSRSDQSHSENEGLYSGTQIEVKEEQDKINSTCEYADDTVSTKKKKKKCKKEKKRYGDMEVEEEFSAAETVIQSPPRNGFHKQRKEHKSRSNSYMSADSDTPRKSQHQSQSSMGHEVGANTNTVAQHSDSESLNDERYTSGPKVSRSKSMIVTSIPEEPTHKLPIVERIAYEDDLDETVQSEPQSQNVNHFLIRKYMKEQSLQNIETAIPRFILTQEDDVWIIKCPQEITSMDLSAVELPVEGKGKIKVRGNTYDGSMEQPDMGHVNVQLCPQGKYLIQSVALKGVLHFRKRIPKPHVRQDDIMVNNNLFIPLPETKTRHPLLGADYSKALKLPAHVARRLREPRRVGGGARPDAADSAERPSKKRKREQSPPDESPPDQPPPRKRKKNKKREFDAAAWDSAQAIEKNLFNF